MGDIQKAYEFLNKTLKLGLKVQDIARAEAGFKLDLAKVEGFKGDILKDTKKLSAEWETKTVLVPRKTKVAASSFKSLADLNAMAIKETQKAAPKKGASKKSSE
jgi:hypothetical protein